MRLPRSLVVSTLALALGLAVAGSSVAQQQLKPLDKEPEVPYVPTHERVVAEMLKVAKVDVDENPAVPGRYAIVGIPTLMLFKGGQVVERIVGAQPKERILAQVLPHLEKAAA